MLCIFKEMKKLVLLLVLCSACSPKVGFDSFFNKEVPLADQAIDLPKWLPMIVIPKDAKDDVKRLSRGMKKVKLLRYTKDQDGGENRFRAYAARESLEEYLAFKDSDNRVEIMSKEDEGTFREILFSIKTDEEYIVFGMTGKMKKEDFQKALTEINERRNNK